MKRRGFLGFLAMFPLWPFYKRGQAETDESDMFHNCIGGTAESRLVDVRIGPDNRGEVLFRIESRRRGYLEGCWWTSIEWETVPFDTREVGIKFRNADGHKPDHWVFYSSNTPQSWHGCVICKGDTSSPESVARILQAIAKSSRNYTAMRGSQL